MVGPILAITAITTVKKNKANHTQYNLYCTNFISDCHVHAGCVNLLGGHGV